MKIVLVIVETVSVVLGIVGIFLPFLPTAPFLLLAAACYVKASPKLYSWLINNKYLGNYIRNYKEGSFPPFPNRFVKPHSPKVCYFHVEGILRNSEF